MTIRHRFFIATAFVASLAMQAPVLAQEEAAPKVYVSGSVEVSNHINNQEIAFDDEVDTRSEQAQQLEKTLAQTCEQTQDTSAHYIFRNLMRRMVLGFAVYNLTHGLVTLANQSPCIGNCASNVASDLGWAAFQFAGLLT